MLKKQKNYGSKFKKGGSLRVKEQKNIIALDNRVYVSNDTFKELRFSQKYQFVCRGLRHRFVNKPVYEQNKIFD
jgi:hypothetical protein